MKNDKASEMKGFRYMENSVGMDNLPVKIQIFLCSLVLLLKRQENRSHYKLDYGNYTCRYFIEFLKYELR